MRLLSKVSRKHVFLGSAWLFIGLLIFVDRNDPHNSLFGRFGWIGHFALAAYYFYSAYRQGGATPPE